MNAAERHHSATSPAAAGLHTDAQKFTLLGRVGRVHKDTPHERRSSWPIIVNLPIATCLPWPSP
jgi:hypothetical protein